MTRQRRKQLISMLLVIVMMLGMFPAITHAAEEPRAESFMKLERAFSNELISALCNTQDLGNYQNYFQAPATRGSLGNNPLEWMLLSYVLQGGQNVDLELWRMPDSYQNDGQNPVQLKPDSDGDALEDFLQGAGAENIGYLYGYQITDHVTKIDEEHYQLKENYPPEKLTYVLQDAVKQDATGDSQNPDQERVVMKQQFAIGYTGEPLPPAESQTVNLFSNNDASDPDFFEDAPTFDMWGEGIANYLLWDGRVCDESGNEVEVDYSTGKYIIVMTPNDERTKKYNRFVAFAVDMERPSKDIQQEVFNSEYDRLSELYCIAPGDPVDLLSGAFQWNYTDTALYGGQPVGQLYLRLQRGRQPDHHH